MTRAFVVGCPRSGTTLAQAMLGAHPHVFTFPESHFFTKVWGRLWDQRRYGVVSPRAARSVLRAIASTLGEPTPHVRSLRFRRHGAAFVDLVDAATRRAGATAWVEKTPTHLHCVDEIESVVATARFVHVVRDGRDVVRSFFGVCLADPTWTRPLVAGGARLRLDERGDRSIVLRAIAERWNDDIGTTVTLASRPNHHVLRYDHLVGEPASALGDVCSHLGLDFDDAMLRHWEVAEEVVGWRRSKPHMQGVFGPLRREAPRDPLLSPDEAAAVEGWLDGAGELDRLPI